MLKIKPIKLPEWAPRDFEHFERVSDSFRQLASAAGKNNNHYQLAREKLIHHVIRQKRSDAWVQIKKPVDIRAYLDLLMEGGDFYEEVSFTHEDLNAFVAIRNPLSRLAITQLIRVYFTYFEQLVSNNLDQLARLSNFIVVQLKALHREKKQSNSPLQPLLDNAATVFGINGPKALAAEAKGTERDLDQLLKSWHISGASNGRYHELCRIEYYIKTLESIPEGADDPVLYELSKRDVYESFLDHEKMIGHKVIEILIRRTSGDISEAWRHVILGIAGDPRIPKASASYRKWWAFIDEKLIGKVIGWLSQLDLQVFLDSLEESAKVSGNLDMQRMFPARKQFLEGLLNQKLVSSSRLFLGREADAFIKAGYRPEERPAYANYNNGQASVIYLKLHNGLHFIEGSHSFKLKIIDRLPTRSRIDDWSVTQFSDSALRADIITQYVNEFNNFDFVDATHANLHWQNTAIEFLERKGLSLEKSDLFTPQDYKNYRRRFGI